MIVLSPEHFDEILDGSGSICEEHLSTECPCPKADLTVLCLKGQVLLQDGLPRPKRDETLHMPGMWLPSDELDDEEEDE